jgi:peptide/nickel transport system permease protein
MLFALVPDPARELAGQNESEEVVEAIRKKYNLDLGLFPRYALFLNNVSPVALHDLQHADSRTFLDPVVNHKALWVNPQGKSLVLKVPFLGRSFLSGKTVAGIIREALPGTIVLAITAMTFAMIIGIFLGVVTATKKDTFIDKSVLVLSSVGMSGPSFFMAILIAWIGANLWYQAIPLPVIPLIGIGIGVLWPIISKRKFTWDWKIAGKGLWYGCVAWLIMGIATLMTGVNLNPSIAIPGTGLSATGSLYAIDVWEGEYIAWKNLILPALTLGIRPLAVVIQLMRSSMLEVMSQDYIRTARAKGLSERAVIWRHAVRNALNPVVTASSGWLASMLAGAVFVEFVFGWKGLGFEVFQALEKNDLPVVMGAVLIIATIFVVINIAVDVLYGWIDPRARIKS